MTTQARIEITSEGGSIIAQESFIEILVAQKRFDAMCAIRWPMTYQGIPLNCSEWPEGRTGSLRLIIENEHGQFTRRELYRHP